MADELIYCRKCTKQLPGKDFYDAVDNGLVDTNGKMSVCKTCVQILYDFIYNETGTMEKTIHRLCILLNIRYSNEAADATKKHIQTLLDNGKNVNAIFSVYKSKLVAINKSMDKSITEYEGYEDTGTIFVEKQINTKEIPVPQEVVDFWGNEFTRDEIRFLETQYANFKQTHKADLFAEIVLLKEICYAMLKIKNLRAANDPDIVGAVTALRMLMKDSALTPKEAKSGGQNSGLDTFGLWIQDIERDEPAQWLKNDPRGDMYRDVNNVEDYFQKYIVRPLKNFILGSKDFNVEDEAIFDDEDYTLEDDEIDKILSENG